MWIPRYELFILPKKELINLNAKFHRKCISVALTYAPWDWFKTRTKKKWKKHITHPLIRFGFIWGLKVLLSNSFLSKSCILFWNFQKIKQHHMCIRFWLIDYYHWKYFPPIFSGKSHSSRNHLCPLPVNNFSKNDSRQFQFHFPTSWDTNYWKAICFLIKNIPLIASIAPSQH